MSTLNDVARGYTSLSDADVTWLHALVAEWQMLADLSFADLLLWAPVRAEMADGMRGYVVLAQMRPTTGPTSLLQDEVGTACVTGARFAVLDAAWTAQRTVREGEPMWQGDLPVRLEAVPVRRGNRVVAVLGRDTNLGAVRVPGQLELAYLRTAEELITMVSEGRFPFVGSLPDTVSLPRVGDGFILLDAEGTVAYASPNAQSAFRRLGDPEDLRGRNLEQLTTSLQPNGLLEDPRIGRSLRSRRPHVAELVTPSAAVHVRSIPLLPGGQVTGALLLVRDVTEVRRRDRALLTKDATIREIHHRVKNNLQTVAALLRMQARRLPAGAGRAALDESVRRVAAIAVVHEMLSVTAEDDVQFDEVADRLIDLAVQVAPSGPQVRVQVRREGTFGPLPPGMATSLSMVLTELVQNAVEHAFHGRPGGTLVLRASRAAGSLTVVVADDGRGLPAGFTTSGSTSLGLQIVETLVANELRGTVELMSLPDGTEVHLEFPVPDPGPVASDDVADR